MLEIIWTLLCTCPLLPRAHWLQILKSSEFVLKPVSILSMRQLLEDFSLIVSVRWVSLLENLNIISTRSLIDITSRNLKLHEGLGESHSSNLIENWDSVTWAVLHAKVDQQQDLNGSSETPITDEIAKLLGIQHPRGSIPVVVLAKAPYLVKLPDASTLVVRAQLAPVSVPLPQSIWQKTILDQFVNFEKLFASMEKGYEHHNDPRDFGASYSLVRKEQTFSKCKLHSEADWIQVFDAWSATTSFFFRHWESELHSYCSIAMEFFHAAPNEPQVTIEYDVEVHAKYSHKPFWLDNQT